jgi:hypothetical protein
LFCGENVEHDVLEKGCLDAPPLDDVIGFFFFTNAGYFSQRWLVFFCCWWTGGHAYERAEYHDASAYFDAV